MFTKKQSRHPQKVFQVFQVFRVFQVFHFAFGPQNRPFLVQIRTNPANRPNRPTAISWLRKTSKKAIHPLVYEHDTALFVIAAVLFRRSGFFPGRRGGKARRQLAIGDGVLWGMRGRSWLLRNTIASGGRRREDSVKQGSRQCKKERAAIFFEPGAYFWVNIRCGWQKKRNFVGIFVFENGVHLFFLILLYSQCYEDFHY